jgi:hypothetical protein
MLIGETLGPYRVLDKLGEGGMGEVYRATDTVLKRTVAIKVLPSSVASDPDRLARFRREAEVLASLNHSNIAQVYGVQELAPGGAALVMEFVPGEDLAARIARGAVPLDETLQIAKQIASALEAAHEQGIVHRDLKPANIRVTEDGTVKVLDFGLAKALGPSKLGPYDPSTGGRDGLGVGAELAPPDMSPTLTSPAMMTGVGVILGTAAYMAPEQAKGKAVDRRADVWAFGVVLYEMLTGTRAFGGADIQDTIVAIIRDEPDWTRLPPALPIALETHLKRCLHKDVKQRIQAIGDVRLALEGAFDTAALHAAASSAAGSGSAVSRALPWTVAAGLAVAVGIALWAPWRSEKAADRPLVRLDVDLGADVALPASATSGPSVAISPDGSRIAYASDAPGRLVTRRLDQPSGTALAGTEGAAQPFFSPDGRWIGFAVAGNLNKISAEGGPVIHLAAITNFAGAAWAEDGTILVADALKGLVRVPADGGTPEMVAELADGEVAVTSPQLLPGGKAILIGAFSDMKRFLSTKIEVITLPDRHRKTVARTGTSPRYLPTSATTGHIVYLDNATLFAVPFALDTLEPRGAPTAVLDDVAHLRTPQLAHLDVSRTGTLIYRRSSREAQLLTVGWIDATGKGQSVLARPGSYGRPSPSPDGQRVALEVVEGLRTDIWIADSQRDSMTRLTFTGNAISPLWTPDGRYIVYQADGVGMFAIRSDGAGQPQRLTETVLPQYPWSFSADGKRLAFVTVGQNSGDLWTVAVDGEGGALRIGKPEPFLQTPAFEQEPALSPDGRWLAYASDESGVWQVYVRAFPDNGGKWQISNGGGQYPMWSRSGHGLLFESLDQRILTVSYSAQGDSFAADKPRTWLDTPIGGNYAFKNVDIAPDGRRILALMPAPQAKGSQEAPNQITFVLNFFDELRRRVPLGK